MTKSEAIDVAIEVLERWSDNVEQCYEAESDDTMNNVSRMDEAIAILEQIQKEQFPEKEKHG